MKSILPTFKSVARRSADAAFARLQGSSAPPVASGPPHSASASTAEAREMREAVRRGLHGFTHRPQAGSFLR